MISHVPEGCDPLPPRSASASSIPRVIVHLLCASPIRESARLLGPLAIAKTARLMQCRAYREQHGFHFIWAMSQISISKPLTCSQYCVSPTRNAHRDGKISFWTNPSSSDRNVRKGCDHFRTRTDDAAASRAISALIPQAPRLPAQTSRCEGTCSSGLAARTALTECVIWTYVAELKASALAALSRVSFAARRAGDVNESL